MVSSSLLAQSSEASISGLKRLLVVVFVSSARGTEKRLVSISVLCMAFDVFYRRLLTRCRSSFDENYGLASTQALKNKDIPEGGAKGTILPE